MDWISKIAGLLDQPKEELPSDVWNLKTRTIHPHIKEHIFKLLYKFIPREDIAEVFIIGSITGYKYKETSDIDINVNVFSNADLYTSQQDLYNGTDAEGTRHPINFHTKQWYRAATPDSWSDYIYGSYDLVSDRWLKLPPARESIRNPQEQFKQELIVADHLARNFLRESEELRKDMQAYRDLKSMDTYPGLALSLTRKQNEVNEDIKDLIEQAKSVKSNRKWIYRQGFGVPRRSFKNIVFKLIEHGQYGELFEALKSITGEELEEAKKGLF